MPKKDLIKIYDSHDIFILPSFTEGHPMALLESLARNRPVIIFDDCNYSEMIKSVLKSSFLNQGQICLSGSRIYVQNGIYNKFKEDLSLKIMIFKFIINY